MTNIDNKKVDGKTPIRKIKVDKKLLIVATAGVGIGLYGFVRGQKVGYERGVKDGMAYMGMQFATGMREVAQELMKTKGG